MRGLAPIATRDNCESLFRNAQATHSLLEYRLEGSKRKHNAVDVTSANAVWEKQTMKRYLVELNNGLVLVMAHPALIMWQSANCVKEYVEC